MSDNTKRKKTFEFFSLFKKFYTSRSISTQLFLTIVLIFGSFFALQTLLNNSFFKRYYAEREFDRIHADLIQYIEDINNADSSDYYDEIYNFTTENNAYSIIVDGRNTIISSSYSNYTIKIKDDSSDDEYIFLVPNNNYEYTSGESIDVILYEYSGIYSPVAIYTSTGTSIFISDIDCSNESCVPATETLSATIVDIYKPANLNYLFDENVLVQLELSKLDSGAINRDDYLYDTGLPNIEGSWYKSTDGTIDTLVFIHELDWNYIVTIVPIVDTNDIINIISAYNYYVYLTAIAIIFIWSFRLSNLLSKPIQNIELVAKEIAQLNFNAEAHEYNNRENESLSKSINLISKNLKETLETINTKNTELTNLYEEQSKQVSLKKQLVSSISHELKTPLMIMQVTIQGILDGIIEQEDEDKELNNVLEEISKSSNMIQDMLQIYRLDDAHSTLDISRFNLSETVHFFVNDFENAIKKYNFDIDVNIQDEVYIEADLKLVKRVISNYLTNAIKYTPINGIIYLEVSEKDDYIYFELTNYGININEDEIKKIWLPFYRIEQDDATRLKNKGSGIGLYLVSEILKAHEADFGIENVKNGIKAYFKMNKKN